MRFVLKTRHDSRAYSAFNSEKVILVFRGAFPHAWSLPACTAPTPHVAPQARPVSHLSRRSAASEIGSLLAPSTVTFPAPRVQVGLTFPQSRDCLEESGKRSQSWENASERGHGGVTVLPKPNLDAIIIANKVRINNYQFRHLIQNRQL